MLVTNGMPKFDTTTNNLFRCFRCNLFQFDDQYKIDGASAKVSLHGKKAVVSYDRELDEAVLKKTIEDAGYTVEEMK